MKLMGKMLAEAEDFWPRPLHSHELQEILSAVIAFKETGQKTAKHEGFQG